MQTFPRMPPFILVSRFHFASPLTHPLVGLGKVTLLGYITFTKEISLAGFIAACRIPSDMGVRLKGSALSHTTSLSSLNHPLFFTPFTPHLLSLVHSFHPTASKVKMARSTRINGGIGNYAMSAKEIMPVSASPVPGTVEVGSVASTGSSAHETSSNKKAVGPAEKRTGGSSDTTPESGPQDA